MSLFHFPSRRWADASLTVSLPGGDAILRPLGPADGAALDEVFEQLSPASREARYLAGLPELPPFLRDVLADVDGRDHVAWLAVVDGRPGGIGRYVRVGPETAELAFEVVDAHQGRGLGTALLDALTTVAMVSGVRRIKASVQPDNHRSRHLLTKVGLALTGDRHLLEGEAPLVLMEPARVNRWAVVRLAMAATA